MKGIVPFGKGRWKIVATRDQPWELYDLKTDPRER